MDPRSPFYAGLVSALKPPQRVVHVNFCAVCHYVWKAPAAAQTCVNCKGSGATARSLVHYETEVPVT